MCESVAFIAYLELKRVLKNLIQFRFKLIFECVPQSKLNAFIPTKNFDDLDFSPTSDAKTSFQNYFLSKILFKD